MNKELAVKIDSIKEVLSNMPQNNKKNISKIIEYIDSLINEYQEDLDNILTELKSRYESILKRVSNNSNKKDDSIFLKYKENKLLFNKFNTPYEKISLDKCVYKLLHFYKNDFENVNKYIKDAIDCFSKVGIKLNYKDFNYSPYTSLYMKKFLDNDSDLKKFFDDVYWKCPNIIFHIALNIRFLYYKYEKNFNKYYENKKKELLSNNNSEEIDNEYINNFYENEKIDIYNLINLFFDKKYDIKDFSFEKYEKYKLNFSDSDIEDDSLRQLYESLLEYNGYKEYKFIIENLKKLYLDKDKYKESYKNTLKEIKKIESKIFTINKKIKNCDKFIKNNRKKELLLIQLNQEIDNILKKYDEFDNNKFLNKIYMLDDSVSYYELLLFSLSYYNNLREFIKKEFSNISDEEIEEKISSLEKFLFHPSKKILKNVFIKDEVDLALIILDKYLLLKIKITKDDIDNNSQNLINIIEKITIINAINNSNISYEEIEFLILVKKILN